LLRSDDDDAARYFTPFKMAAMHKDAKIRTEALDAIQKLISEKCAHSASHADARPPCPAGSPAEPPP